MKWVKGTKVRMSIKLAIGYCFCAAAWAIAIAEYYLCGESFPL